MKFLKCILSWLIILSCCSVCLGQKSLMFYKNKRRQAIYEQGDVLSFRIKTDPSKITDQIMGFEDSLIVFRNYKVNPAEITDIYVDDQTQTWYILRFKYERLFLFTGIGYLLIDGFNSKEITQETLIISGSLIGAGLLCHWLISKKIKIKGRRKLVLLR